MTAPLVSSVENVGVGVHDVLSARLASDIGLDFVWLSSFSFSAANGCPDAGLLEPRDVARLACDIAAVSDITQVVDMDAGYGDLLKVYHASRLISLAGASALCIEDNPTSKRSSLYAQRKRKLASTAEHVERISAVREGCGRSTIVIARTEALVAGEGVDSGLRRASAYVDAGADAVFVQATKADGGKELSAFCTSWGRATPLFLAPTRYPNVTKQEFFSWGASHVIFANHGLRSAHAAICKAYRAIRYEDDLGPLENDISSVDAVRSSVCAGFSEYI
jgi:phosphoenolpyruvate phosphomutase